MAQADAAQAAAASMLDAAARIKRQVETESRMLETHAALANELQDAEAVVKVCQRLEAFSTFALLLCCSVPFCMTPACCQQKMPSSQKHPLLCDMLMEFGSQQGDQAQVCSCAHEGSREGPGGS